MKKCLVTIIAVLYLTVSTGATIHMHYCMGKMVAWGLWRTQDKDACVTCNMDKKKGCCEDKKQRVKIESNHNLQSLAFYHFKAIADLPQHNWTALTVIKHVSPIIINFPITNSPPGLNKTAIHISNCVFLI